MIQRCWKHQECLRKFSAAAINCARQITKHPANCVQASISKENSILNEYYTEQLVEFQQRIKCRYTLKVGEYPINDKADKTESAALMKVIEMIYNLEESIRKRRDAQLCVSYTCVVKQIIHKEIFLSQAVE